MPRDTVGRTITVAVVLCLVCSLLVSATTVALRPRQAAQRRLDKMRNILIVAGLIGEDAHPSQAEIERLFERIETRWVDLEREATLVPKEEEESIDTDQMIFLPPDMDIARIKRHPRFMEVYFVRNEDGSLDQIVLPISGLGLWSVLHGFIALDADLRTIRGLGFYEHKETPGLGGEVDNPKWRAQWRGKTAFDETGRVCIRVEKPGGGGGSSDDPCHIDALSGATFTSKGVQNAIHYWLGENGFGPLLKRLQQERNDGKA
ncbi:MAG: Na(+)-translocating NADH-quinone reductase subunit C [Planctomycetota bacterium]|nr:MAG: Na(+)-translocating NADH-quinone reductase subunit C [Planctomycetota bacterium]